MLSASSSPSSSAQLRPLVGVLAERRYLEQQQPRGLVRALREKHRPVHVLVDDEICDPTDRSWCRGLDVLVARGRSERLLTALDTATARGVPVVDGAAAVRGVLNKATMSDALTSAGVPTPAWATVSADRLASVRHPPFPLILKPITGDNARGLRVVHSRAHLSALAWPEPVALAQTFHRGDGHDIKVYVAGRHMWAVRRRSPIDAHGSPRRTDGPGRLVPLTPALRAIARSCARVFGLTLFGVDCVMGPAGPLVIEVNDFPTYRGVGTAADEALAAVVLSRDSHRLRQTACVHDQVMST